MAEVAYLKKGDSGRRSARWIHYKKQNRNTWSLRRSAISPKVAVLRKYFTGYLILFKKENPLSCADFFSCLYAFADFRPRRRAGERGRFRCHKRRHSAWISGRGGELRGCHQRRDPLQQRLPEPGILQWHKLGNDQRRGLGRHTPGCGATATLSSQQQTTISVPAGCHVIFKVWGGGGAGGSSWPTGGGGGDATITLGPLGSTTTYYLVVGGGGISGGAGGAGLAGYTGNNWVAGPPAACGRAVMAGQRLSLRAAAAGLETVAILLDLPEAWQLLKDYTGNDCVTVGGTGCGYGGGGAGYPNGGLCAPFSGLWTGGGGSNYAASGGATAAGYYIYPGDTNDANRPAHGGEGSSGYWTSGYDGAIYYTTY